LHPTLIVLDTMVVIAAVSGDPNGPSAAVLDAISTGEVRLAVSDDQLSELVRVFGYPEVEEMVGRPVRAFEVALDIGYMGVMHHPRRLDWPSLHDPNDAWMLDLAHASGANYIVSYDGDVEAAAEPLGFECVPPEELLEILRQRR
jgi:putative PIN family toxin of toxin-antitoxin system